MRIVTIAILPVREPAGAAFSSSSVAKMTTSPSSPRCRGGRGFPERCDRQRLHAGRDELRAFGTAHPGGDREGLDVHIVEPQILQARGGPLGGRLFVGGTRRSRTEARRELAHPGVGDVVAGHRRIAQLHGHRLRRWIVAGERCAGGARHAGGEQPGRRAQAPQGCVRIGIGRALRSYRCKRSAHSTEALRRAPRQIRRRRYPFRGAVARSAAVSPDKSPGRSRRRCSSAP